MKKYLAEIFGTFGLVFIGCGSVVFANGHIDSLTISLCFGLGLTSLAYFLGGISGCHVNPAVSFGFWCSKRMSTVDFFGYVASQFIGAIIGAFLLMIMAGGIDSGLGSNAVHESSNVLSACIYEALATFIFVSVILEVTKEKFQGAGLIIGLTLGIFLTLGFYITGGSMNPARSFGPALLANQMANLWIFLVCPSIGGICAGLLHYIRHK